jgi:hypothetical protein
MKKKIRYCEVENCENEAEEDEYYCEEHLKENEQSQS